MSHRPTRRTHAFTLIELLVVIAIIALLIGILIPALGKARTTARNLKCLAQVREMGSAMTLYANDNKSAFPVKPPGPTTTFLGSQSDTTGGLSGFFSLNQVGANELVGSIPPNDDRRGWTGTNADDDADPLDAYPPWGGGSPLNSPLKTPLMRAYLSSLNVLTCPSDKEDIYYGPAFSNSWTYPTDSATLLSRRRAPRVVSSEREVASTNISYLYIAGLKTDEPGIPVAPPLFGDETNGPDNKTKAWYGATVDVNGATAANAQMEAAGVTNPGGYGRVDNHGAAGANFVYADGHAAFTTGNIQAVFFSSPNITNSKSINSTNPNRSAFVETVD
ncbi:MAG TPA: prepilin-type N-terminal cleavage/methylation domain-containing protein [Phycisphaerales bacterium]|nr:prepilin-type N-terminal cleavage/methylation domain-containing protein [Phycisphaerales bacterium]